MKSHNIKYLPALDHLRAYAACLILLYHGVLFLNNFFSTGRWVYTYNPLAALMVEGHTAVAMFMVLSGFLFTFGVGDRRVSYFGFLRNRFLRIYPLFILLLVIGAFIYPAQINLLGILETVFFLANLPDAVTFGPVTALFWSISVEFQFYFLFPLLLLLLRRYGSRSLVVIMAAALFLRVLAVYAGYNILDVTYLSLLARIDQFLIGMIAARLFTRYDRDKIARFFVPSVVLVLAVSVLFNRLGGWFEIAPWRVVWPLVEGVAWACVLVSYIALIKANTNFIGRALSKVGELSYSIYLLHFSVWWYFTVTHKWYIDAGMGPVVNALVNAALIILPVTLVLSAITFYAIERPFLRLRVKYLK